MQRFQSPRTKVTWKQLLYSPLAIGVLLIAVVFMIHATWQMYKTERESYSLRAQTERQRDELRNRDMKTAQALAWAQTPEGQEYVLRTKYSVSKPGERLYVIVDKQGNPDGEKKEFQRSWWQTFLDAIGGFGDAKEGQSE